MHSVMQDARIDLVSPVPPTYLLTLNKQKPKKCRRKKVLLLIPSGVNYVL
jgi:hypothetical protein